MHQMLDSISSEDSHSDTHFPWAIGMTLNVNQFEPCMHNNVFNMVIGRGAQMILVKFIS